MVDVFAADVAAADVAAADVAATDVLAVDAAVVAASSDDRSSVVPDLEQATSDAIITIKMAIITNVPIFFLIEDN